MSLLFEHGIASASRRSFSLLTRSLTRFLHVAGPAHYVDASPSVPLCHLNYDNCKRDRTIFALKTIPPHQALKQRSASFSSAAAPSAAFDRTPVEQFNVVHSGSQRDSDTFRPRVSSRFDNNVERREFARSRGDRFNDARSDRFNDARSDRFNDARSDRFNDARSGRFNDARSDRFFDDRRSIGFRNSPNQSDSWTDRSSTTTGPASYRREGRGGSFSYDRRRSQDHFGPSMRPKQWTPEALNNLPPLCKNFYTELPAVAQRTPEEIKELLALEKVTITGDLPIPKPINSFSEVTLPGPLAEVCKRFSAPTAIQKLSLPVALSGRDFIGVSETGSGKTLAFLLPGIVHIQAQLKHQMNDQRNSENGFKRRSRSSPVGLVLAPTRELVEQIYTEAMGLNTGENLRIARIYGGASRYQQSDAVRRGADLIIACPGRLLDFLRSDIVPDLDKVTYLVLDEADRMLDMGFERQVRAIVSQCRPDRQTSFYSATWPRSIGGLARDFCRQDPVKVQIGSAELHANPDVIQEVKLVRGYRRLDAFLDFVKQLTESQEVDKVSNLPVKILAFCQTRRSTEKTSIALCRNGISADAIHGDKNQSQRDAALHRFRTGRCQVLVATDVAARGLDVKDVTHVINADTPGSIETYIHRIGRTGRAGQKGTAITFLEAEEDRGMLHNILQVMKLAGQKPSTELLQASRTMRY